MILSTLTGPARLYAALGAVAALLAALSGALAYAHHKGYAKAEAEGVAKMNAYQAEIARESFKITEQTTRDTVNLVTRAAKTDGVKNATIQAIAVARDDALERLRHERASRESASVAANAATPGATGCCTGARLCAEDAGFLVGEAARSKIVVTNLAACQALYNDARNTLIQGMLPATQ